MTSTDALFFDNPAVLRKANIDDLVKALDPLSLVKFLQQFDTGSGDYTKNLHLWLDSLNLEAILRDIEGRRQTLEWMRSDPDWKPFVEVISDLRRRPDQDLSGDPEQEFVMNFDYALEQHEASLVERGIERGIEQGLVLGGIRSTRANVIEVYEERFGACPERLRARIEETNNLGLLQRWHRLAVRASAPEFEAQVLAEAKAE